MNYIEFNSIHKQKMNNLCSNVEHFEWEDDAFIDILKGELPQIRYTQTSPEATKLIHLLKETYEHYSFYDSNPDLFSSEIRRIINEIRKIEPYWSGLFINAVEDALKYQKGCLISGEGGIGKSYFIKCLEDELTHLGKKHLCLYGKFCPDIEKIDFSEIETISKTEEFVFLFDALNEIDEQSQIKLSEKLKMIQHAKGLRIIVTSRTHFVDDKILALYRSIMPSNYSFPGVSFESVIEWLQKIPIIDINEYLDVLYSNNPSILSKLPVILNGKQDINKNNTSRFTYIYEQFIKKTLDLPTWEKTKLVAQFLYKNNKKVFSVVELTSIIDDALTYIAEMERIGFISRHGEDRYSFVIESLADYLLARQMWNEIEGKSKEECIEIIKQKNEEFFNLNTEAIIIMLFDKFYPDYVTIYEILIATELHSSFDYDTLLKIHFKESDIADFLKIFKPTHPEDLLAYFAGYLNKPFNCTNFLNDYYLSDSRKQTVELSQCLSGRYISGNLKGRLKNILYFTCKYACTKERAIEIFYTALWCSASCTSDIRALAIKILFEIIQRNPFLIKTAIKTYAKIEDDYIKSALIFVLSSCSVNAEISSFLSSLLKDSNFILAESLKRISVYFDQPYDYINLEKKNIYLTEPTKISEDFEKILHRIDLMEKDLLPFRFWGIKSFEMNPRFLPTPKDEIKKLNIRLAREFGCVKNGVCNGDGGLERRILTLYGLSADKKELDKRVFLSSLEKVFKETFLKYELPFDLDKCTRQTELDFSNSLFRKCICISMDIFLGSLMCNYYLNDFVTYNNIQDSIGYEVYDPLEYKEDINVKSPLPIFQPKIEKLCSKVLSRIKLPAKKDECWWQDIEIAKENTLGLLQPIKMWGHEWLLLSCRISLNSSPMYDGWEDTYTLFSCSSTDETLKNNGNERYLTIELNEYNGLLEEYIHCTDQSWLCKSVPSVIYDSGLFENTRLVLPPADIITTLNLSLNLEEMYWYNTSGERLIYCNNNKASYHKDPITETVFIRKDALDEFLKHKPLKFFSFSQRFLSNKGFCDDTALHFEIIDGKIEKEYPNYKPAQPPTKAPIPTECKNCSHAFFSEEDSTESFEILLNLIKDYDN